MTRRLAAGAVLLTSLVLQLVAAQPAAAREYCVYSARVSVGNFSTTTPTVCVPWP